MVSKVRSLPLAAHLVPYVAFMALAAALLSPGVVPGGIGCDVELGYLTDAARDSFIRWSSLAFGALAALLLLSAVAASAQRRGGSPGRPTRAAAAALALVTVVAVIEPHAPWAAPAQAVIGLAFVGSIVGVVPIAAVIAAVFAARRLRGPGPAKAAQIAAWIALLVAQPVMMALTYLQVTPLCLG